MSCSRLLFLLPALVFLPHVAEEFPRFPAWATRHFGVTTRAYYVYSHVVLVGSLVAICWGANAGLGPTWSLLAVASQWVLLTNACFHCATTVLFKEYSPGVVTAVVLFFPSTVYVLQQTWSERLLTRGEIACALALGTVVGGLVIASLWLRMDFDWSLRRRGVPRG